MTDTMPEQAPAEDEQEWSGPGEVYPSYPDNPHNHRFTISMNGQGPMLVVRANTADEVRTAFEELESGEAGAAIGRAWAAIKAGAALGNGLGATPVPQGAPAAPPQGMPQVPTPPPFGPNVSVPGAPGYQGPPAPGMPMPPAPAPGGFGGGQQQGNRGPKPRPADWPQVYKIDVPFQMKDQFKAFREQYKDQLRGKVAWAGGGNYWIHGDVAQSFANYNPVPA
jgi:hypothetical protein